MNILDEHYLEYKLQLWDYNQTFNHNKYYLEIEKFSNNIDFSELKIL